MTSVLDKNPADKFETESRKRRTGLATEFWDFLKHNKKWWLLPIVVVLLLLSLLVTLNPALMPFIYPLF